MVLSFCRSDASGSLSRMVLPYDFDILRPSVPGSFAAGVSSGCGSGKTTSRCGSRLPGSQLARIELVEAARHLARQLDVRHLVFAHRHKVCLVNQDVRRLQQRISQKAIGAEVLVLDVFALFLVTGHALQPS